VFVRFHRRPLFCLALLAPCLLCVSCVAPLGPGYIIEDQQIRVHFLPGPEPRIRIEAEYKLKNTGNQAIPALEMRLPGRRFHLTSKQFLWDSSELTPVQFSWNPRVSVVPLPDKWAISERHIARFNFECAPPENEASGPGFAGDAFLLAAGNWNPELMPAEGLFGFGGVPPEKWTLLVTVPTDFLVHMSGGKVQVMAARNGSEQTVRATQTRDDHAPFVIAGRYASSEIAEGKQQIHLWTRSKQEIATLKRAGEQIAATMDVYNKTFGTRASVNAPLWIVECPAAPNCFPNFNPRREGLLGEGSSSAEMISADTLVVDLSAGMPKLAIAVAPSLAASWLGYGQNPGFYDQTPPLSALPLFAAALGRESLEGPAFRTETIRRALRTIPKNAEKRGAKGPSQTQESPEVLRAKSLLFFYGLQDHFGSKALSSALTEMLAARRGRGFNMNDLIAALWDRTGEDAAEFERIWMKRPGVPEEFRQRYEGASAITAISKENLQ